MSKQIVQLLRNGIQIRVELRRFDGHDIFLIREINTRFNQGELIGKCVNQFVGKSSKFAIAQMGGSLQLTVTGRGDRGGDAFGLGQIYLAGNERAECEFARFGQSRASRHRLVNQSIHQRRIAGHLQLGHILPRVGARHIKKRSERGERTVDLYWCDATWFKCNITRQVFENITCGIAAETNQSAT